MPQPTNMVPPTTPGEVETLTFDYSDLLGDDEFILSVESVKCAVVFGSDDPAGKIIGSNLIIRSPETGKIDAAVLQRVGDMVGGVIYQIQCLVQTTGGQTLRLSANMSCDAIPTGV